MTGLQISNPEIAFESDEENQTPISHREIETSEAWQVNFDWNFENDFFATLDYLLFTPIAKY